MQTRTIPCLIAAGFLGVTLTLGASQALAAEPQTDFVVQAKKFDPNTQRIVSYRDLNLAARADQRTLNRRIYRTARSLCTDMNGWDSDSCTSFAVRSTDDQVDAAIARAQRQLAGLPVGPAVRISMVIAN